MDRMRSMEVFVEIVDRGGMSRAAAAPHLASLEARLGKRLFDRSTRRLDLTREGRNFLDEARRILASVEAAENAVRGLPGTVQGRVRIDAPASVGHRFIVPELAAFRQAHPRILLDLSLGDRGTTFRADGFDVVVRVGEGHLDRAHVRVLGTTGFVHVAAPDYLARRGTPIAPADIEQHDGIVYASFERPEGNRWRYWVDGAAKWLRPRPVLSFNDGAAIAAAAMAGHGISRTLEMLVVREIADGRLVRLYDDLVTEPQTVSAVSPLDRHAIPAVAAVLDFLQGLRWSG